MDWWFSLIETSFCFAVAATGFAFLFNAPKRSLPAIALLGFLGGLCKLVLIHWQTSPILAAFVTASLIGILALQAAHIIHAPQTVLAIPSVIPLVPGTYTYKMMLGLISLTGSLEAEESLKILSETVKNGLTAVLITLGLSVGVAIPLLISRKNSGKFLHWPGIKTTINK